MFKKKVGRPSNAYKKRVRNFRLMSLLIVIAAVVSSMLGISNYVNKLGASVNSVPSGSIIKDYRLQKCAAQDLGVSKNKALSLEDLQNVESLNCYISRNDTSKMSLEGIEQMKSLKTIDFMIDDHGNEKLDILDNVDLSKNKSLEFVNFNGYDFGINNLKLPSSVTKINVTVENPSKIDLRNNTKLEYANIYSLSNSSNVNVKNLPAINYAIRTSKYSNDTKSTDIQVPSNRCIKEYDGNSAINDGFTVISLKNSKIGEYKIQVTPPNTYKWRDGTTKTKTITCKITKKNISNAVFKKISKKTYTGKEIKPKVEPKSKVKEGTDYTVSYKNNIKPGTASIVITGKGNYTGTKILYFVIDSDYSNVSKSGNIEIRNANRNINYKTKECDSTPTTYNLVNTKGLNIVKVEFKVTLGEAKSSYRNWTALDKKHNSCAGTPSSNCKITMKENHLRYDLVIHSSDGSIQTIKKLSSCVKKSGTGSKAKGSKVKEGDDEDILSGFDYYDTSDLINATINKIPDQTYTGKAIKPNVVVKMDGKTLTKDKSYTVSYSNNVNVGTATVTVTGKGNYTGTKKATFKIKEFIIDGWKEVETNISKASIDSIPSQLYTGKAITPNITVKLEGNTLTRNKDYTVSYSNNVNVGTATVTVTGKGNYTGTKKTTFKIEKSMIDDWETVDNAKAKIEVVNRNRTLQDASCYTNPLTFTFRDTSSSVGIKEVQYKTDTIANWTKLVAGNNRMDVAMSIKNYHEKIWFKVIDKNNNATEFGPYKTNIKSSCATSQQTQTQQPTQQPQTQPQQTGPVQVNTIKVSGIDTNGCKNRGISFTVDSTGDNGASISKIEFSTDNKTWKTSNSCTIGSKKATCKINNAYSAIYYKVTTSHNHYQIFGKYCTK